MTATPRSSRKQYLKLLGYIVLLGLLALLVAKQHTTLMNALAQVAVANGAWLTVGILAMALSLPATAGVYMALVPKRLPFGRTVLVQTAGFCVNKLLPSGSGAAGVSFLYLRANKVPGVLAGAVVLLNNLLGFVGHIILFLLLVALQPRELHKATMSIGINVTVLFVVLTALFFGILTAIWLKSLWIRRLGGFLRQLVPLFRRRTALSKALGYSILITLAYTVCLFASAQAVGGHISLVGAIIALSSSVLATSVVPTPGGIGAAEAGAYAGLVAVGLDHQQALAAALLYRVCSFWLPLAVGSVAFAVVAKRGYLRTGK